MRRLYLVSIAAVLTAFCAAPAFAQQDVQQRVVTYGDLNLDNPEGAHVLVRRIENASGQVCNDRTGPRPLRENSIVHACKTETADNAVDDVDHPMVTAEYYGEPTGTVTVGEDDSYVPDDQGYYGDNGQ